MPGADRTAGGRQRHVDAFGPQHALVAFGLEFGLSGLEELANPSAGLADPLAGLGTVGSREGADGSVGQRDRASVAAVGQPGVLQGVEVGSSGEGRRCSVDCGVDGGRGEWVDDVGRISAGRCGVGPGHRRR